MFVVQMHPRIIVTAIFFVVHHACEVSKVLGYIALVQTACDCLHFDHVILLAYNFVRKPCSLTIVLLEHSLVNL